MVDVSDEPASYLVNALKHAWLRVSAATTQALEPCGIDGKEFAVLLVVEADGTPSQQRLAERLDIDRTTMVALVDALEAKHLLARRPDPDDRRRNLVRLTRTGTSTLRRAVRLVRDVEKRAMAGLSSDDAAHLTATLHTVAAPPPSVR